MTRGITIGLTWNYYMNDDESWLTNRSPVITAVAIVTSVTTQ